jgi:DNA mismatch endonuclease (patch repair protein)
MADILNIEQRHLCMSRIRSKDTKPEILVRHYLFSRGYRYRKNVRKLPGTPDIVLRKYGVVIFIHGCFWHGHEDSHLPKTNTEYWKTKIERNKARDERDKKLLKEMGWNVMTVWECQLKPAVREKTFKGIEYWINKTYLDKVARKAQTYQLSEGTEKIVADNDLKYK